jgi:shikimate dehydrogenase
VRVFGVIGDPVGHSMSPAVHNAGFDATGFNGVYLPLRIPPEYEHFKATVSTWLAMPELHFRGASVTIPHKENLLRFVREQGGSIEPLAEQIGAANTLTVRDDGSLFASNSDYAGALDAVCDGMGITREALAGKRVAVIGAGGAARAIVAGFANYGATVVVYNRTTQKAEALAEQFNGKTGKVVAARLEKLCDSCCEVFINCTPIGMHPNVDASPIPAAADTKGWGAGAVVFDTVYNPLETKLLRDAKAAGCTVVPGTEMFTRQAAAQFEQWTDTEAPLDVFNEVLLTHLRAKGQA